MGSRLARCKTADNPVLHQNQGGPKACSMLQNQTAVVGFASCFTEIQTPLGAERGRHLTEINQVTLGRSINNNYSSIELKGKKKKKSNSPTHAKCGVFNVSSGW